MSNISKHEPIAMENMDLDTLEQELEADLEASLADLEILEKNRKKIGTPEALGETICSTIWEQIVNQIGATAGEEFIRKNKGMTLDLSDDAHIQTTENFKKGKIATHNTKIDFQERYDNWQNNFVKDENGNIETKFDPRSGKYKEVLKKEARVDFDKNRPTGGGSIDIDHTISSAEQNRDAEANAHLSRSEQIDFANSEKNLNPLDRAANRSKGDSTMEEFLNSERDGKKPAERFNIDEDKLREKDREARKEFEKRKKEGEKRSVETGKQSQKEEAMRIGGEALKAAIMGLLASLLKSIIKKFVLWIKDGKKNISELIDYIKIALKDFFENIKEHLKVALDTSIMAVVTAIIGPIARTLRKIWFMITESIKSVYSAIKYIRNPENKNKPLSLLIIEASKIIVSGISVIGAMGVGEFFEKTLMAFPVFAIEIPLLGSLASIVGIFLGALVTGIIGAVIIQLLNKLSLKYQKRIAIEEKISLTNEVINLQNKLIDVKLKNDDNKKETLINKMHARHSEARNVMINSVNNIMENTTVIKSRSNTDDNDNDFDMMNKMLDDLES